MTKPHNLPDDLLATPALQERFFLEAHFEGEAHGKLGYWFLRQRDNGKFSKKAVRYVPEYAVQRLSEILLDKLNKQVALGGAWILAWVNNGDKMVCMWMDGDGDVRFTLEVDAKDIFHPVEYRRTGLEKIVQDAYDAWSQWHLHMVEVLEPKAGRETYRRALGEKPPTAR